MVDDVYLHIGPPKTGTTYIQSVLWDNPVTLMQQGVWLPLGSRRRQYDASADLRGGIWATQDLVATWDQLVERVHAREGKAVVSEELLGAMSSPASLTRAVESLAPARVHIVAAVRDYGRGVPANWQQALRARSSRTYSEYLDNLRDDLDNALWKLQDPTRLFEKWEPYLQSPRDFHVITVPKPGSPKTLLWERFASVIGVDPDSVDIVDKVRNESLGVRESELLRRFNQALGDKFPLPGPYIDNVVKNLIRTGLRTAPGAIKIGVPEEHVEWLTERSDALVESTRKLGEKVSLVGDPEDLRAAIVPATRSGEDLSDGEVLEVALETMIRQLEGLRADQERRLERRQAAQLSSKASLGQEQRSVKGRVKGAAKALLGRP